MNTKADGNSEDTNKGALESLDHACMLNWIYPIDITPQQAEEKADEFKRNGITHVLTEDHRYILYDLKDVDNPPHFHFICQPKEPSVEATRIITEALHSRGLYCIHHVTSTYASQDFAELHSDWTQRDARYPDKPLYFGDYGGVHLFCPSNPDFRREYFKTVIDITKRTGVDGWMIDEIELLPDWYSCGCAHCRKNFKEDTGYDLPTEVDSPVWENFDDPTWRAWLIWRMKSCADFFVALRKELDAVAPGQIITGCHAGISDTWSAQKWGNDLIAFSHTFNYIFYEAYIRNGAAFHNWRHHLAEMRLYSAAARKTGYPVLTLFYTHSLPSEKFAWSLSTLAGCRSWIRFNAGYIKPPIVFTEEEIAGGLVTPDFFIWQREYEFLFDGQKQLANIALLFSKQTRDVYQGFEMEHYTNEWRGWADTLSEYNFPYAVIIDEDLDDMEYLREFDLLVVPHAACLSDAQVSALLEYRAAGGKLLVSGDTGLCDETGKKRDKLDLVEELISKSKYLPGKIGVRSHFPLVRIDEEFRDKRDAEAVKLQVDSVNKMAGETLPFTVEAPVGVIANVFKLGDGSLAVHLLNGTGTALENGTVLPDKVHPVSYPVINDIMVKIRKDQGQPEYKNAVEYKYAPDNGKNPVSFESNEDCYAIKVSELKLYAVIHLTV